MIKKALILGGANCVFVDYEKAVRLTDFDTVIAINDVGIEIEEVKHWCTMHPEHMPRWLDQRRVSGFNDPKLWTAVERMRSATLPFEAIRNTRGGSGLLAIYVARYLGYQKIVLAGVPMSPEFEHYHTAGGWRECRLYRNVWAGDKSLRANNDLRSLSGWSRETYGEPNRDWFVS